MATLKSNLANSASPSANGFSKADQLGGRYKLLNVGGGKHHGCWVHKEFRRLAPALGWFVTHLRSNSAWRPSETEKSSLHSPRSKMKNMTNYRKNNFICGISIEVCINLS
ncbi:hypothetical protein [Pseudomonas chlororaphis]|uniref:hypothetical protein n=1 Tax=Pseudomonas chlororaphis TaxID=587753 RepID=UPI0023688DCB|nr:hypothetical protein [Pseudomonas chlororaphis]WDH33708.1 hypothetical protein PUP62_23155 [Pseudomonas chlororaphis]WDH39792.1 hypothetical protein PUP51_23155 [Pseudomonas chlororaphis]